MAQLVERSFPTPGVHSSNSVIGKTYIEQCLLSTVFKDENKEKRGRDFLRKNKRREVRKTPSRFN